MTYRAGFWIRLFSTFLDLVPAALLAWLSGLAMLAVWDRVGGRDPAERIAQLLLQASLLLYTSFEIWTAGTPGKLLLGLRIASTNGSPADRWRRTLRWTTKQFPLVCFLLFTLTRFPLLNVLGGFTNLIVCIGCLYAANDDHLAWHDQWAGTAVVRLRRTATSVPPALPAGPRPELRAVAPPPPVPPDP